MKTILILFLILNKGKITQELLNKLKEAGKDSKIPVIVHLKEKPEYKKVKKLSPSEYVEYLKRFSRASQKKILDYIENNFKNKISDLKTYWIFNGFYMKATPDVIYKLSEMDEVEYINYDFEIRLKKIEGKQNREDLKTAEWNIQKVKADSCWAEGFDGSGVIVGHMDSGFDPDHPAISGKWLSPYWYDAVNGSSSPYDDCGHGTHTIGTVLGGDGPGPFEYDIGVAPGAQFVSVKTFDSQGVGYPSWIHAGFQQIAQWKADGVDIKVCTNSWGSSDVLSLEFWDDCVNWRNIGIIPVFANGNNGPSSQTAGTPGNFPVVIGVGATDINDNIASFSSRGPAPNAYPWNDTLYWPREDWNLIKPNISAPGVNVRSAVPGGGYEYWSGTSMATPHVAGAIALMFQKNPDLTFDVIYSILLDNTYKPQIGEPYPNNNYGWGILDAYHAILNTPSINSPFLTLLGITYTDDDTDGLWEPGENLYITVSLKNIGGVKAQNVNLKLSSSSPYITILDSISVIDSILPESSGDNSDDPFQVYALNDAPFGTLVEFTLYITVDTSFSKTKNFSKYIGVPGKDWIVHNCGNIQVTLTRYGTIGFMNSSHTGGVGIKYPKNSSNQLFFGSFSVGSQNGYMIDRYYEANFQDDEDWRTLINPDGKIRLIEPYDFSDEYSFAYYDDSYGEVSKGITCVQKAYTYSDSNADDFIILEYILKNTGNSSVNGVYAGLFLDWDVNGNADQNTGGIDISRRLSFITDSSIYMGSAILNPKRERNRVGNVSLIDNVQYVNPYYGLPDSIQLKFLTGDYSFSTANYTSDWSSVISAGPFDIDINDSIIVAFVIAGGNSLNSLEEAIDTAYSRYWKFTKLAEKGNYGVSLLSLIPDFVDHGIHITYYSPLNSTAFISLYNVAGAKVCNRFLNFKKGKNVRFVKFRKLKPGIYIVRFKTSGLEKHTKLVILK